MNVQCKMCETVETPTFLSLFRPYSDVDWVFPVYECRQCGVRFAVRDPSVNYHEVLHSTAGGGYHAHYRMAKRVKEYLTHGDANSCERYLVRCGNKYAELINFIKGKDKNNAILEVGCSSGFMTAFFQSLGYEVEGVDISESAVDFAKVSFGPYYGLKPNKEQYDTIVHLGLIGCVDDPKAFISGYLDLLKPKGDMFFNAPNAESVRQLNELWVSTPPPDLVYLFNEKSFQNMLGPAFHVTCTKRHAKREMITERLQRIRDRRNHNGLSKRFFPKQGQRDQQSSAMKRLLSRILVDTFLPIYPLLKKHDTQYGLFVTVKKN